MIRSRTFLSISLTDSTTKTRLVLYIGELKKIVVISFPPSSLELYINTLSKLMRKGSFVDDSVKVIKFMIKWVGDK